MRQRRCRTLECAGLDRALFARDTSRAQSSILIFGSSVSLAATCRGQSKRRRGAAVQRICVLSAENDFEYWCSCVYLHPVNGYVKTNMLLLTNADSPRITIHSPSIIPKSEIIVSSPSPLIENRLEWFLYMQFDV